MNIDFKIVWFEDEDTAYRTYNEDIENTINSLFLIPRIKRYRDGEFDADIVNDADLILADYDLQSVNSVDIINNQIRSDKNYVTALLYSSHPQKMEDKIRKVVPTMEGVFCVKRVHDEIIGKLRDIIIRLVKRSQSLENLRGIMMEYTSIFDKNIVELIKSFCQDPIVLEDTLKYINGLSKYTLSKVFYKKCTKEKSNCVKVCENFNSSCIKRTGCCFSCKEINHLEELSDYDLSIKSRILNQILKIEVKAEKLDKQFLGFYRSFCDEIIQYRNALAHEASTDKKLYIKAKNTYQTVDEAFYNKIRKNIVKYFKMFESIKIKYNF